MRYLVVLSIVLACVYARETALRVKWGVPLLNWDYFIKIPRAVADIQKDGWVNTTRPTGCLLPSLTMYCMSGDLTFCALYDTVGILAGLQIALSKELFTEIPYELTSVGFLPPLLMVLNTGRPSSTSSLKTEAAGITEAATVTLREGAIWVVDEDGNLMKVGATGEDMSNSDVYIEQACIPSMGLHYFYGLNPEATCDKIYPWFTLINNDILVGTGIAVVGNFSGPAEGKRLWFEQPSASSVKTILSNGPECVFELAESPGITTMHIFYNDRYPYTIFC